MVQLTYFLEVARHGSMTEAAKHLHVSQSTLSSAIGHLESAMGSQLLQRNHGKGVVLTSAGRAAFSEARALVADFASLPLRISEGTATAAWETVLGIYAPLAPMLVPTLLARLESDGGIGKVRFVEAGLDELSGYLVQGRIDAAIMYDYGMDARFRMDVIASIAPHVIVPGGFDAVPHDGQGIELRLLAREPFVMMDLRYSRECYAGYFRLLGVRPRIEYTTLSYEMARSYVAAGYGYSIMHHRIQSPETYTGDTVQVLEIREPLPPVSLCLASAATSPIGSQLEHLLSVARGLDWGADTPQ